jgi:hypothetical protein
MARLRLRTWPNGGLRHGFAETPAAKPPLGHSEASWYTPGVTTWIRLHGTTAGAIFIASTLTIIFGIMAVDSWLGAFYPDRLDPKFARLTGSIADTDPTRASSGAAGNTSALIGLVMGIVVILSIVIIIGLTFRGQWAREAAFVIYGFLALLVLAASLGGLAADPPAPSAWTGVLVGVADLAIVGLLMAPATSRDFSGRPANRR